MNVAEFYDFVVREEAEQKSHLGTDYGITECELSLRSPGRLPPQFTYSVYQRTESQELWHYEMEHSNKFGNQGYGSEFFLYLGGEGTIHERKFIADVCFYGGVIDPDDRSPGVMGLATCKAERVEIDLYLPIIMLRDIMNKWTTFDHYFNRSEDAEDDAKSYNLIVRMRTPITKKMPTESFQFEPIGITVW